MGIECLRFLSGSVLKVWGKTVNPKLWLRAEHLKARLENAEVKSKL